MKYILNICAICMALLAFLPIENNRISFFDAPFVLVWSIGITVILLSLLVLKILTERNKI